MSPAPLLSASLAPAPPPHTHHAHRHIDANALVATLQNHSALLPSRVTPKLFQYNMKNACLNNPQHVVLPEVGGGRVCVQVGRLWVE